MIANQPWSRDLSLDFVKGALVVVMVIYHTMNYFATASPEDFGYVRFVSGSFIFISGYIVSTLYQRKYERDHTGTCKRLVVRGLKLLAIFTVLNVLINLVGPESYKNIDFGIHQYMRNLGAIYVMGSSKMAAFHILLPIAYLLILSPVYLILNQSRKITASATLLLALCGSFFDIDSSIVYPGIIGLVGLSIGMVVKTETTCPLKSRSAMLLILCMCISVMGYLNRNLATYIVGIAVVLKLTYDLSRTMDLTTRINQGIILFGQYSLLCYIVQILFLHVLHRTLLKQRWGLGLETISIFLATNFFLFATCIFFKYFRVRSKFMDESYRLIFS